MKVAVVTADGSSVSPHFGRAAHLLVLTVEDGKIIHRELRDNPARVIRDMDTHTARRGRPGEQPDCHGFGAKAAADHQRIAAAVADCTAVLAGGMSWASRQCLAANGLRPVITDIGSVDQAVAAYLDGTIVDHVEWLHWRRVKAVAQDTTGPGTAGCVHGWFVRRGGWVPGAASWVAGSSSRALLPAIILRGEETTGTQGRKGPQRHDQDLASRLCARVWCRCVRVPSTPA